MKYANIQADTLLHTGKGRLFGVIVGSHTSGAIKFWDSTSAAFDVIIPTYTYATGSQVIKFSEPGGNSEGIEFRTGLYADITGVQDITVLWQPTS